MAIKYPLKKDGREHIWYRGENCNFLWNKETIRNNIEENILPGLVPDNPFITKQDGITVFGSCFASGIFQRLKLWGYNIDPLKDFIDKPHYTHVGYHYDSMINSFTVLQQFEWAYENRKFEDDVWQLRPGIMERTDEEVRNSTKLLFDNTDVFIVTFGLSEVWQHKLTKNVFWRAVPEYMFNPDIHEFKVSSCEETIFNIKKLIEIIRKHRGDSTIVFTISPVRLNATFRPIGCIPANSVSKAILRAGLDEVLRERVEDKNLYYWPSYEIVTDIFEDPYQEDARHPKIEIQEIIMNLFQKYYLLNE